MMKSPPFSVAGFVLAGGHSSRMGVDKSLALFRGKPLIVVALEILAAAGIAPRIAGARSDLAEFAEVIPDAFPDSGPMGGIVSALMVSRAEWNVFLPVDLPCMPAAMLTSLLNEAFSTNSPVTCAALPGFLQDRLDDSGPQENRLEPFPVVLHASVLPHLVSRIERQSTSCHQAWQAIPSDLGRELKVVQAESLVKPGQLSSASNLSPAIWFQSANTPEELARLNSFHFAS